MHYYLIKILHSQQQQQKKNIKLINILLYFIGHNADFFFEKIHFRWERNKQVNLKKILLNFIIFLSIKHYKLILLLKKSLLMNK